MPRSLEAEVGGDVVHVTLGEDGNGVAPDPAQLEPVRGLAGVREIAPTAEGINVTVADGGAAAPEIMRLLHAQGLPVANLSVASPSLDDMCSSVARGGRFVTRRRLAMRTNESGASGWE